MKKKSKVTEKRESGAKVTSKFTRYVTRSKKETEKQQGRLFEKEKKTKTKEYGEGLIHPTEENTNSHPIVVVKMRGRGYTVIDVARNIFYLTSEVKFNDTCTVACVNSSWRKKGKFFFDHDKREGLHVKDEDGNLVVIEHDGILRRKFKNDKGKTVIEESPIPAGYVYMVTHK